MKRSSATGLCVVAVFAVSGLAAVLASASSPEYKACVKVMSGGEFSDRGCSIPAPEGKYRLFPWNQASGRTFQTRAEKVVGNNVNQNNKDVFPLLAALSRARGELAGPKTVTFTEEYVRVTTENAPCRSPGEAPAPHAGKIKTNLLEGQLVQLAGGKVGEVIKPAAGPEAVFAEYECGGRSVKVRGALIAEVEGLSGAATKTYHLRERARGGEPNHLQEFPYLPGMGEHGEGNPAEEEDTTLDYVVFLGEVRRCVRQGKTKAACEASLGPPFEAAEGYPPPGITPFSLVSEIGPPTEETLAGVLEASISVKGGVIKIV
jgi:hypothetical protein